MTDGNENLTKSEGKKTKQVMVRLPRCTVERIDDFAGYTHSSRPDFITDAVRQYIRHILEESSRITVRLEDLEVSKDAKDLYFTEQMGYVMYDEYESYRKSRENDSSTKDVSVLVSMPVGLDEKIRETMSATGLFSSNQEFIKVAVEYLFILMDEVKNNLETVKEFQALPEGSRALEEELEEIRKELSSNSDIH